MELNLFDIFGTFRAVCSTYAPPYPPCLLLYFGLWIEHKARDGNWIFRDGKKAAEAPEMTMMEEAAEVEEERLLLMPRPLRQSRLPWGISTIENKQRAQNDVKLLGHIKQITIY